MKLTSLGYGGYDQGRGGMFQEFAYDYELTRF